MNIWTFVLSVLRNLALGLGVGWLVVCVVAPVILLAPKQREETIMPLPIAPVVLPTPTDRLSPRIVGYNAYTLAGSESLQEIAHIGGSDAASIMDYNRLHTVPVAGRTLIVPHLEGQVNTLPQVPVLVVQGRTDQPRVALTLDAGAGSAPASRMLDTLRERQVHVTFFLTGTWMQQNPQLVRRMVAEGHEIANHSLTHPDFTTLDAAQMIEEIGETERLAGEIAGATTRPFFRPPYGAYNSHVLLTAIEQGYLPIYWTLDSLDSVGTPKTAAFLVERVTTTLSPEELHGAIILAHCGSESTAEALPIMLDRFAAMGLEVRPLSEVLGQ